MKEVKYSSGWGYYNCSPLAAEDLALMNGACFVGYSYVKHWHTGNQELVAAHFFDVNWAEIGMYSYLLECVQIFDKHRRWADEMIQLLRRVPLNAGRKGLLRETDDYELRDGKMVARAPQ